MPERSIAAPDEGAARSWPPAAARADGLHRAALATYTLAGQVAAPLLLRHRRLGPDPSVRRLRAGLLTVPPAVARAPERLWFHGASVGEIGALPPLIAAFRRVLPEVVPVVSALTDTGLDAARGLDGVAYAFPLPVDLPVPVERCLDAIRPKLVVIVETEIWPRLLTTLSQRSIPVAIVNGRLSPSSVRWYRRLLRPLFRPLFGGLTAVAAQSDADAERFIAVGVAAEAVRVTGSSKIDVEAALPPYREPPVIEGRRVVVAGSIRRREETLIIEAWRRLAARRAAERGGQALMVLAPRHLDRVEPVLARIAAQGLRGGRRSALGRSLGEAIEVAARDRLDVVVLDTLGELASAYDAATVAVVGGGFVETRGHNLLEPAVRGRPVLYGARHVGIAGEEVRLRQAGAGHACADATALAERTLAYLDDAGAVRAAGEAARAQVEGLRGAADRAARWVGERLERPSAGGGSC